MFDADFVPAPDFARALMDHFTDPRVGMVQARWGHLNRESSLLTRAQSILLDGHFVLEHAARNRSGRFFNFNGTAGIWRRACIEDAGGWHHDTLTEDLDLSYRAQLRGWRFVFVERRDRAGGAPRRRWAPSSRNSTDGSKGRSRPPSSCFPRILRSALPRRVKLESVVHLTANAGYVLMAALAAPDRPRGLAPPRASAREQLALVDLPLVAISLVSIAGFYLVAQREAYGSWRDAVRYVPVLMAVGVGISISNAHAVVSGLDAERRESSRARPSTRSPRTTEAGFASRGYRATPAARRPGSSSGWDFTSPASSPRRSRADCGAPSPFSRSSREGSSTRRAQRFDNPWLLRIVSIIAAGSFRMRMIFTRCPSAVCLVPS